MSTYTRKQVEQVVIGVLCEQIDVERSEVTPGATLVDDLGADSLIRIECVLAVEEVFAIDVSEDAEESLRTVGDVVELAVRLLGDRVRDDAPPECRSAP